MGKLIIIEGLDGCGKSTQTALLEKYFDKNNVNYRKIKLPDYDSPSSTLVNMYLSGQFGNDADSVNPYAAGAFYAVDRYASYKLNWGEDYNNNTLILADRYATSNSIYQMEKLDESLWDYYLDWSYDFEYEKIGIPKPDLVIFLDMPVEISQKLMTGRYNGDESKKDIHEVDTDFLERCRKAALYAAFKQGWAVIPCSDGKEPLPVSDIHNTVISLIKDRLKEDNKNA